MADKPTDHLHWAEDATGIQVSAPDEPKRAAGWSFANLIPYNWLNFWWRTLGRWLKYLKLGPLTFDRAAQAMDQGVSSGGYILQTEVVSTSAVGHRVYVGTGLSAASYVRTVNARWDVNAVDGPKWTKDVPGDPAYAWNHDQYGLRFFTRLEGEDTPWTDGGWTVLLHTTEEGNTSGPQRDIYRNYPASAAINVSGWTFELENKWTATNGTSKLILPLTGLPHGALLKSVHVTVQTADYTEATVNVELYAQATPFAGTGGTQLGATANPAGNTLVEISITANEATGFGYIYYLVLTVDQVGSPSPVDFFGCRVCLRTGYNQF